MSALRDFHEQAMELADLAFMARVKGNASEAAELFCKAFEHERRAAELLSNDLNAEPTRSVLHRSAAALALDCAEYRAAEKLVATALSGDPPEEIADELRDLLEQVYFARHLDLRGIVLDPTEFQVSIAGNAVGFGVAESRRFVDRIRDTETLIYRTAERWKNIPFKEHFNRSVRDSIGVFMSVPREASLAVSFRIGRAREHFQLLDVGFSVELIDELFTCLQLFDNAQEEPLKEHIQDESYYRNFVGLARRIAPDGQDIRQVGFTSVRGGIERRVALTKARDEIGLGLEPTRLTRDEKRRNEPVKITGELRFADSLTSRNDRIHLLDSTNRKHSIIVPEGMMNDIVRPLWGTTVEVSGVPYRKAIKL